MSPALSTRFRRVSKVLSIQTAWSLHFLVLVWCLLYGGYNQDHEFFGYRQSV